ncbi:hypothetical protein SASPL_134080 [Salvia splendens]|uniref:AP-2 complex subunit sigma n=1 Tax=Salvia splendens TaxID=180675 RepID=A0A8X8X508_SALSN|nr:hypothetical protein SASPL_134080 [Salvia splendens]
MKMSLGRFRKIIRGFTIFPAPSRSFDGAVETPKTSCSSSYYFSSNSHKNEAIADCIEFLNKLLICKWKHKFGLRIVTVGYLTPISHVLSSLTNQHIDVEETEIRFILLQNRQGKTRLAKYYIPLEESEKHKVEYEVHRLVVNRDPKFTNFVEFRTHKVIYRRYAGLFFSLCVDITDNELAYLESIHLFVEILDHFFSNVCELDLVFNFHKVYLILDEFILAGELQETSKKAIIERMGELEKLD